MIDFQRFYLTFRKAESDSYVVLRAFMAEYDLPWGEPRPAMCSVSFYWTRADFERVVASTPISVDGYHVCKHDGELWTFLDWEMPRESSGRREVPFRVVTMPYRVQKILLRLARWHFHHLDRAPKGSEHEVEISLNQRKRLIERYGQAKGSVKVEEHEVTAVERAQKDAQLRERLDQLERIARNTTWSKWETATVHLYRDSAGYYFNILTPSGRRSMNGGVINHGTDDKPDWSIHT